MSNALEVLERMNIVHFHMHKSHELKMLVFLLKVM